MDIELLALESPRPLFPIADILKWFSATKLRSLFRRNFKDETSVGHIRTNVAGAPGYPHLWCYTLLFRPQYTTPLCDKKFLFVLPSIMDRCIFLLTHVVPRSLVFGEIYFSYTHHVVQSPLQVLNLRFERKKHD